MRSLGLDVQGVTDLIASKFVPKQGSLSVLKLHKLLYYAEAWHAAFYDAALFEDDFEAWVHGPVCRPVFKRFRDRDKLMYSEVLEEDLSMEAIGGITPYETVNAHVENVLETYGAFSGSQLEQLTHREDPWRIARGDRAPYEPCSNLITKESMRDYYRGLLKNP